MYEPTVKYYMLGKFVICNLLLQISAMKSF